MQEKDLLKKLHSFKDVKPDAAWKKSSRDILLAQISSSTTGGADEAVLNRAGLFAILKNLYGDSVFARVTQPVGIAILIVCSIFGAGVASIKAARDTKPGDSLYIAKIISEKARVAVTFDEQKKIKLGLEIATNRAEEIKEVMKEEDDSSERQEKISQLAVDLNQEISVVKKRLDGQKKESETGKKKAEENKPDNELKKSEDDGAKKDVEADNTEVFRANLGKESKGMEISDKKKNVDDKKEDADKTGKEDVKDDNNKKSGSLPAPVPTSTEPVRQEEKKNSRIDLDKIVEEARKNYEKEDYDATLEILGEVNRAIDDDKKEKEESGGGQEPKNSKEEKATSTKD
jgi:hypothetical protein